MAASPPMVRDAPSWRSATEAAAGAVFLSLCDVVRHVLRIEEPRAVVRWALRALSPLQGPTMSQVSDDLRDALQDHWIVCVLGRRDAERIGS
jgi:hypothetical protein